MARYIDFDKIDTEKAYERNEIYYRDSFKSGVVSTLHLLAKMHSEDVEEVKHAEWRSVLDDVIFACSNCDAEVSTSWDYENDDMFAYCPCCGAKMDCTPKERGADKPKVTCLNCKHLMFSDMYGECNIQLRIVNPSDTCKYAEPKERGGEK